MSADVEEKIIDFTIVPDKVQIDRRTRVSKEIKITAIISTNIADNPPLVIIIDPNGKDDAQRANRVETTRPLVTYVRNYGVNQNNTPGDYNVKLEYTGLPPKEDKFTVEWKEID